MGGALSRYQAGKIASDFIATDPKRFGKLTGWHTAGLNISGSFLLGVISAMPTVDVDKINQFQSNKPFERFQGLSPRAKLMLGVGMYLFLPSTFCGMFTVTHSLMSPRSSHSNIAIIYGSVGFCGSFTTFSTFSCDVVTWVSQGQITRGN